MPPRRATHMKMLWLKRESISHSKNLLLGFEKASNNKRHKPRFSLHWSLIFFDATRARGENGNELTRRKRMGFVSALSPEEMRTQIYEVIFESRTIIAKRIIYGRQPQTLPRLQFTASTQQEICRLFCRHSIAPELVSISVAPTVRLMAYWWSQWRRWKLLVSMMTQLLLSLHQTRADTIASYCLRSESKCLRSRVELDTWHDVECHSFSDSRTR